MAQQKPSEGCAQDAPEHQDRGLFGIFGKKKEDEQAGHPQGTAQETPVSAEQKQQHGLLGKLHQGDKTSSGSSSEEDEGGEKKEGGGRRKKKGMKEKIMERVGGGKEEGKSEGMQDQQQQHDKPTKDEEQKGFMEKIKGKLPGQQHTKEGEPGNAPCT